MAELLKEKDFDAVFALMEASFPPDEYRPYAEQMALLKKPNYLVYGFKKEKTLMAFAAIHQFDDFLFIEHLAVAPQHRNQGLGALLLAQLSAMTDKRICLEVEPPEGDLQKRRIGFYERNGFFLNQFPYVQPAISKGRTPVPLLIMSTQGAVGRSDFDRIKDTLYRQVYGII